MCLFYAQDCITPSGSYKRSLCLKEVVLVNLLEFIVPFSLIQCSQVVFNVCSQVVLFWVFNFLLGPVCQPIALSYSTI